MLTSTTPGIRSSRPGMCASLATRLFLAKEIVEALAAADHSCVPVADQHGGRAWDGVVIRAHREGVGARRGHGEQVAAPRLGQANALDQDVARFAVLAADVEGAHGLLVGTVGEQGAVAGVVELRARVV